MATNRIESTEIKNAPARVAHVGDDWLSGRTKLHKEIKQLAASSREMRVASH